MTHRRSPRPTSELDLHFRRLRRELAHVTMDADFPRRVEAAIRARQGRRLPGWAAVAAAVVLALGAGLLRGDDRASRAHLLPNVPATAPPPTPPAREPSAAPSENRMSTPRGEKR